MMADHEMRKRLAAAMGWTSVHMDYGNLVGMRPDHYGSRCWYAPNPLENDHDAARLRAWCINNGLSVQTVNLATDSIDGPGFRTRIYRTDPMTKIEACEAEVWIWEAEESDPCRRERLALCRAVLQAIEAGGEA